ncbi:hypothetical protein QUB80_08445 [Chlorogloeopsis sp. ULAP01]|uniref:hypothetical protein n=1 Tax=Chlorogloeopsis sp. ULAP01 TaxID=3056483 RepID=UPI0025AAD1F5|nr:hypothetical protein [Chlorogloeopsis sp. ULAP01]MDM9380734.1 hypothetical protein [Chlorogloeopsis sp. ULAP01]
MGEIKELWCPPIEQLVCEIKAVNRAWKAASELFGEGCPLSTSSRDLKTCLQVRLLRCYAPKQVYLAIDKRADGEKLYSLYLREPIENWRDADHLPVRVAKEVLKHEDSKRD